MPLSEEDVEVDEEGDSAPVEVEVVGGEEEEGVGSSSPSLVASRLRDVRGGSFEVEVGREEGARPCPGPVGRGAGGGGGGTLAAAAASSSSSSEPLK